MTGGESNTFAITFGHRGARRLLVALLALELLLVALYALMHVVLPDVRWGPFREAFDLDGDLSIPAWFSSVQLFLASVALFALSRVDRRRRWFLVLGSLVFLFLSADEGAGLHESITVVARGHEIGVLRELMIRNHGAWIVPYLLAGVALVAITFKAAVSIFTKHRRPSLWVIFGVLTVVAGAVGLEIVSYFLQRGTEVGYFVEVAAEEWLEMLGISLVLYGILSFGIEVQSTVEMPSR